MEGRNFLLGLFVVLLVASGSVFVVAVTGNCLFHVCEDEAVAIAQEYARGTVEVEAATAGLPVHNVEIKHEGMETAIAIDAHTGEVLAVHEEREEPGEAEGPDVPITGTALEQAKAAALKVVCEGKDHCSARVTDTEEGDEESYYEVEVQFNGREIDVQLDEQFVFVGFD
jgi:uncharacterized membrane protein YkoI